MLSNSIKQTRKGAVVLLTIAPVRATVEAIERLAIEISDACRQIQQDDAVRVLVVIGSGSGFGPDTFPPDGFTSPEQLARLRIAAPVAAVDKPVIAAINGPASGLGFELALACDIRIASAAASFAMPHLAHGLLPWDGGTQRLQRLVGPSRASELLLTGKRLTARQALDIGLVQRVVPASKLKDATEELASKIASYAPIALRYAKEALWKGTDMPLEQALRLEADLALLLHTSADRAEGLEAFLKKRTPKFEGR
ncbi:MAG: hypothetical protein EXR67_03340 [Dehalococcoidia bacterium]|nr:hypothetical protein [Dehalococcoidia bacterium]